MPALVPCRANRTAPARFGFQGTSTLDALLDKTDVPLEAILDDDDLLQECKAQNTRLIDLFRREDVVQRLLSYVSGNIEGEGMGKFKYGRLLYHDSCAVVLNTLTFADILILLQKFCAATYGRLLRRA